MGDRPVVAQVRSLRREFWRSARADGVELRERKGAPATLRRVDSEVGRAALDVVRRRLAALLERQAPWPGARPDPKLTEREMEALRAMGYVE